MIYRGFLINYFIIKYKLLNTLIDYEIPDEFLPIESTFRGIHQMIEINLIYILKNHEREHR